MTSSSDGSESSADHDGINDCVACAAGTHRANASVTLQTRLVGGDSAYEGRVEVYSPADDMWGSVDNDYWDSADAEVVCRSLGMGAMVSHGEYYENVAYGRSESVQWVGFDCGGDETTLQDCTQASGDNSDGTWGVSEYASASSPNYDDAWVVCSHCLLYTSPSRRD